MSESRQRWCGGGGIVADMASRDMTLTQTFVVRALDPEVAAQLRGRDDAGRHPLAVTDADGGSPLRCCLRLSRPGEAVLLASYAPVRRWAAARGVDPAAYDEVGPVFLHAEPCDGYAGGGWPEAMRGTPRVLRAYDGNGRIVGGTVLATDDDPEPAVDALLQDERVAVVHARAVLFGCYTFAVERPDTAMPDTGM
jgi:hypothetical protein